MPLPRVVIVGRPNVGKSSLLNMLAQEKVSIVDPTPGVTRDRVAAVIELEHPAGEGPDKPVELIDTGGFGVYTAEGQRYDEVGADLASLTGDIESQIGEAVASADLILFCVDAQAGITPQDEEIARLLREGRLGGVGGRATKRRSDGATKGEGEREAEARTGETAMPQSAPPAPIRIVATKVDGPKWETHAYELAALGFGEPLMCSAKNNYMRRELRDRLYELVPEAVGEAEPDVDLKLAIIGKRNAGKSTLVNALAGQQRVIVSEIAGTTRDAVDVRFDLDDGRSVLAIDTAGLRRKKSFQSRVEWFALDRSKRAIERADVVLLLLDATEAVSQVDQQLAMMCQKTFKPVVIVVNKWDLAEGKQGADGRPITSATYEKYIRREFKGLTYAPIALMSAAEGLNLRGTLDLAFELHEQASHRVGTGELNRVFRGILEQRGPSAKLGQIAKIYFVTQVQTNPPTIVLVVNNPDLFDHNYMRYLDNQLRESLPFEEVPMRIILRSRKQVEERHRGRRGAAAETGEDLAEMIGADDFSLDPADYFDDE
jgi:GTPase